MKIGWFAMVALGCSLDPNPGGQFGEEDGAACRPVARIDLGLDDTADNGVVPADMLAMAEGVHVNTLTWQQSGAQTGITLGVDHDVGAVEYVQYAFVTEAGDPGMMDLGCENLVEIEVDVTAVTEDGALAEALTTRLQASSAAEATLYWALDAVAGTFDPWDHAPEGSTYDDMRAWVDVTFTPSGLVGRISGQGSGVIGDPDDPNSVAYAESVDIATWGDAEER